jgi:arsenate reductase-like glutaredoxin family protein
LKKEPMLFKRPVIEHDGKVLVAFNEDIYKETFL